MKIPLIKKDSGVQVKYPENLYFSPQRENGKPAFVGTDGLVKLVELAGGQPVRQIKKIGEYLYCICGNTVYRVDKNWDATTLSTTLDTSSGNAWIETNGTIIVIVAGDSGYTISSDVVTKITDSNFPIPSSLTYQDTYFIVTRKDTGQWYISTSGTSWDATDYVTAEANPDNAVTCISDHRELFVFGTRTAQIYQNTGASDFPFELMEGGYIEKGTVAAKGICKQDNTIFGITNDRQIFRLVNYTPIIISTRDMENEIEKYPSVDDMISFAQVVRGHTFVWFVFPSANKTWVYDVATDLWHRRVGWQGARHRANCYEYFNNTHVVGDFDNGNLYKLDPDTYTDDDVIIKRKIEFPIIEDEEENRKLFFHRLELDIKTGVGLTTGQGSDPIGILRWSDDGETWSNEHWVKLGKIGKYSHRFVLRRLGSSRGRIFEFSMTDPVQCEITHGYVRADLGVS